MRCIPCQSRTKRDSQRRKREDPVYALYYLAQQRARKLGVPFTITMDDVRAVYPADGKCPVLGLTLARGTNGKAQDASPTLDRMNSAWGYEKGNVCVISFRANAAKRSMRASELEAVAKWMRSRGLD